MTAVVCRSVGSCGIEALDLIPPSASEVLVRIEASGICHSDVSVLTGALPVPLPSVLGHEGAGVVVDVGSDVTLVRPGDRVVLSAIPACGMCYFCARAEPYLCSRSEQLRRPHFTDGTATVRGSSGLGTFSEAVVVSERAVIPVRTDLPSAQLALMGCAVLTGAGAAINIAAIGPGDSVMVIGAGGIGLCAIQGARVQGASPLIALDPAPASRDLARTSGATHAADPRDGAVDNMVLELTGGIGVDAVIDCVGMTSTFEQAWRLTRTGGTIVLIGIPGPDVRMSLLLAEATTAAKRIVGCRYGSSSVFRDVPRYVAMAEAGHMDFSILLGDHVSLADVPDLLGKPLGPGRTIIIP